MIIAMEMIGEDDSGGGSDHGNDHGNDIWLW